MPDLLLGAVVRRPRYEIRLRRRSAVVTLFGRIFQTKLNILNYLFRYYTALLQQKTRVRLLTGNQIRISCAGMREMQGFVASLWPNASINFPCLSRIVSCTSPALRSKAHFEVGAHPWAPWSIARNSMHKLRCATI